MKMKPKFLVTLSSGFSFDAKDVKQTYFSYPLNGKSNDSAIKVVFTDGQTRYYHPDEIIVKRK